MLKLQIANLMWLALCELIEQDTVRDGCLDPLFMNINVTAFIPGI